MTMCDRRSDREIQTAAFVPGDREIASRIWSMLVKRLRPTEVSALARIAHTHPTTSELADHLGVSQQQAGNICARLYREGFIVREKAGTGYRYSPAFPAPMPWHYFDHTPIVLEGAVAERAAEILVRRGTARRI